MTRSTCRSRPGRLRSCVRRDADRSRVSRCAPLLALLIGFSALAAEAQPVRRNYYDGDWVSYVMQRQVTGLTQGFDIVYIGTPEGVGRFSSLSNRFLPPLTASSGLDDPRILRLAFDDGSGTLWIDTPLGPASYNEAIHEWRRGGTFPSELVREDAGRLRFDNLFTPFELAYFPPDHQSPHGLFRDRDLRSYPITTAFFDAFNANRVWFGAWNYGLGEIDRFSQQVTFRPYGPYQSTVLAMHRLAGVLYVGGQGEDGEPPVISMFDLRDSTWSYLEPYYKLAAAGEIVSISSLGKTCFFGTSTGLLKFEPESGRWRRYSHFDGLPDDQVTALFPDGDLLWVGTRNGPGLLDPRPDTGTPAISMVTSSLPGTWVYDFCDAYGYIWMGTETGLYRIRQGSDWGRITTPDGLLRGRVRGLAVRPEGIWCATDAGLLLLDSQLVAQEIFRDGGDLTDGDLFALAVDDANLWVAGRSGLWRYIRAKSLWRSYTRADGLLDDFVYDLELDGNYIWMGSTSGLTRFLWNNPMRID